MSQIDEMSSFHGNSFATPVCSCGRKQVLYQCQQKSCTRNADQEYYCQLCKDEERHPHYPVVRIRNLHQAASQRGGGDGPDSKWQEIGYKVEHILKYAQPKFKNWAPLIRYLDNESARGLNTEACPQISKDYSQLCKINKDIDWILEKVTALEANEAVFEMLAFEGDLQKILETFNKVSYLGDLNEEIIYQKYKPILQTSSATTQDQPFVGFRRYHRDAMMRLKFRALNERIELGSIPSML